MFIESKTSSGCKILLKMEDISVVREMKPEYPDFKTKYCVFVNTFSWFFTEEDGKVIYEAWKEFLIRSIEGV